VRAGWATRGRYPGLQFIDKCLYGLLMRVVIHDADGSFQEFYGEDVGALLGMIDTLIARKSLLYPNVREYILKHDLSFADDTITLTVGTAPVPETIQRRS